jgi:hypothetical protein
MVWEIEADANFVSQSLYIILAGLFVASIFAGCCEHFRGLIMVYSRLEVICILFLGAS